MRTGTFNDGAVAAGRPERRFRRVAFDHRPDFGDRGLVLLHLRGQLIDERTLRIDRLLRDDVRPDLVVAREVGLRVGELHLVGVLLGQRLVELGLVAGWVDLGQEVALPDVLAFLEIDGKDLAVDLRLHGDRVARARRADAFQGDVEGAALGVRHEHRHRAVAAAPAEGLLLAAALLAAGPIDGAGRKARDKDHQKDAFDHERVPG
jgi:hypothetical protein